MNQTKSFSGIIYWSSGIVFTFLIALIGLLLTNLPIFTTIGQMASAIFVAILFRQIFGYPERMRSGINFSSKKLLRLAIILYGLKLNISVILQDGIGLLFRDAFVIAFAILFTMWLAKILKADENISMLAAVGTGVCGAAAIAAVAPIVKAKDEDTALSVAMIALVGTIFAVIYTIIRPFLPLSPEEYGIWSGMSLHELAHVALAADPAGSDALAIALLAKLGRVFLLIPLCFILIYYFNKKRAKHNTKVEQTKIDFPWFLIGFIAMSIVGNYVLGPVILVKEAFLDGVSTFTTWCLTAAMVGLGLNISIKDIREKALRPLTAMLTTSILLSVIVYFII